MGTVNCIADDASQSCRQGSLRMRKWSDGDFNRVGEAGFDYMFSGLVIVPLCRTNEVLRLPRLLVRCRNREEASSIEKSEVREKFCNL